MSDTQTTPEGTASPATEGGDGGGALPTPTPSPTPGAQPDAGALAAQLEAADRRARDEQGRADRLQAQLDQLRATPTPAEPTPAPTGITLEQMRAEHRRVREFLRAETELQSEFGSADPALFRDADSRFDSVEAFRAAVEESHRSIKARVDEGVQEERRKLLAELSDKYGPLELDAPGAEPPANGGLPTPSQLSRMSMDQWDAIDAEHGAGTVDRIIATATRKD